LPFTCIHLQVLQFVHCHMMGVPIVVSELTNLSCLSLKGYTRHTVGMPLWITRLSGKESLKAKNPFFSCERTPST
jgi:hypothetical protein